ncbi:MAG: HD-GYP domain-containing protein [Acidobacteria bacterium OLB17]|nr:MAG: HD-GYP domain-containing protein [Acidobacteria bacterium OLB17]MCZ2389876.1 HD domain-containing protein [Acidobacteriota bacterium]
MHTLVAPQTNIDVKLLEKAAEIDVFTGFPAGHSGRVASLAASIGAAVNLVPDDIEMLKEAALLRDIGELRMDRDYIRAARILTAEERLDLRRHSVIGEQEAAKHNVSRAVQLVIRWNHEWWNGSGYPDGLTREEIPLKSRILRVADAYGALRSARPFRAAYPEASAKKYLIEWAGIEFDPLCVKLFLSLPADADPFKI